MKRLPLFLYLFLALSLALSSCGGGTPTQSPATPTKPSAPEAPAPTETAAAAIPAAPRVLKIANTANITTWDPVESFSTEAAYMANVYEQLLRINPPGSAEQFTPLLAERWESNPGGTVWTFYLRKGVKFHDGEPLTAEAVVKSLDAARKRGGASFIWWMVDSIEAVDDLTVQFNLSASAPIDLVASSLYGAWIVSPKALAATEADENYWADGKEAGTGPYFIQSYVPDQEIVFQKFGDYWGGWEDNQFDTVLVQIIPEALTQQQLLESGSVDLATSLPRDNYVMFKDNPKYTYYDEPSFFNYVGFFNTLRPPLDNVKVRQALSYAIPYNDIIQLGVKGLGTQSRGPVPAGVWPWSPDVKQYTYDIEKAKELLKEAGYEGGGFSLRLTYAAENATHEAYAPLIKDAYAELGVDVTIEAIAFGTQWAEAKNDPANAQDIFLLLYWPTYSDAGSDNLWSMFYYTEKPFFNLSYWNNPEFNALVDEAISLTVSDPKTSQEKYVEAMNLLVDEAPGLFFFDTRAVFVIPKHIEGFKYNLNYPFVQYFFYDLRPAK